jgi:hypothetical protein
LFRETKPPHGEKTWPKELSSKNGVSEIGVYNQNAPFNREK